MDVCTFCNTAIFARAATAEDYSQCERIERECLTHTGKSREKIELSLGVFLAVLFSILYYIFGR